MRLKSKTLHLWGSCLLIACLLSIPEIAVADGGYFYNSFTSPGDDEEDGTLQGVILNGGFLFHWGK